MDLFEILEHMHFDRSLFCSAFGGIPAGEMERHRKNASVAPRRAFEGESLRFCFAQAF